MLKGTPTEESEAARGAQITVTNALPYFHGAQVLFLLCLPPSLSSLALDKKSKCKPNRSSSSYLLLSHKIT
jgi:hypothetical protein